MLRSTSMASRAVRTSASRADRHDTTVYPVEEKMGEDLLQRRIMELLRPLVERWLAERGITALTGADQFVYFRRGDTRGRVAPDVFVLPGVEPRRRIKSWKVWQQGIVPSFALEVVSSDVDKDYIDAPALYRELGVGELVIFDPDWETDADQPRFRFQVYRRVGRRGLVRVLVTNEDRVASRKLGCHVRAVGTGDETRLRLASGANGDDLYPTPDEEKERERAEKERERALRVAAEQEVRKLRAENAMLRKQIPRRR